MLRALLSTFAGSLHHKERVEERKDCLNIIEDKDMTQLEVD